ncbi:MAG: TSCPD domain-containing protein [Cetobacterium sp.]|uniref:TSCPD domain-containing protein n=1 Tax=Cetobacterium sp. TaxID=2071632 RepID=UPI003F3030A2
MKNKLLLLTALLSLASTAFGKDSVKKDVKFTEPTYGVCSREMSVEVKDGKIVSFSAAKGCPGNLLAISKLLPGMEVSKVIDLLDDNYCAGAPLEGYTSCMDNLVEMLKYHVNGEGEGHIKEIRKQQKAKKRIDVAYFGHVCSGCGLCNSNFT